MTYNSILDGYFSTYWISMGTPVALIILYYVFRHKIRKGKESTFGEVCAVMGFAFVMIMTAGVVNPLWWGYGSPEAVREIRYTDGKLLVIDHLRTMGSESDEGTPCSRVHVIDPATGEKQLRFTLGEEADLIGVHGDTLVVSKHNEAIAYSLTDGHEYVTYSEETLPGLFPELSSGIANTSWGGQSTVMQLTANNGKRYNLYLTTGHLYSEDESRAMEEHPWQPTGKLYAEEETIKRDDERWGSTVVELEGKNGNQYELFLTGENDSVLNNGLSFLDAEFLAVTADSNFIILSYETLEHKEFVLTCVSYDCQQVVWQIHQAQYNATFNFTDYIKPHTGYSAAANTLTFWIESSVYCVDAGTGKLLWETKL